jgi:hypothetical protein
MKKLFLYLFGFISLSINIYGQIPNNEFESWTLVGVSESPANYYTSNAAYRNVDLAAKTTHSSSAIKVAGCNSAYALRVQNVSATVVTPTDPLPGFAVLISSNNNVGIPMLSRPSALTGSFIFEQGLLNIDTACVLVTITKWNPISKSRETVGEGKFLVSSNVSLFSPFNIDIRYANSSMPDSAQIYIQSSISKVKCVNTSLTVDKLAFIGSSVNGINNSMFNETISTYPNPTRDDINIKNIPQEASVIEILDFKGTELRSVEVTSDLMNISTENFQSGIYFYLLLNENGDVLYAGKFNVLE